MDGNVYAVYNPSANIEEQESIVQEMSAMHPAPAVDGTNVSDNNPGATAQIGLANANNDNIVQHILGRQTHWRELNDRKEHARLHKALITIKG
jgi:hypothetical protein